MKDFENERLEDYWIDEDFVFEVENSFDISFTLEELDELQTFGELSELILNRIQLTDEVDCTTQQAFYRLRDVVSRKCGLDPKTIRPELELASVLPRETRKEHIKEWQAALGMDLDILDSPKWVHSLIGFFVLGTFVSFFISWKLGLSALAVLIAGVGIAISTENELNVFTLGDLARKLTRKNYIESRRDPSTVNRAEIDRILQAWFRDKEVFTPKSRNGRAGQHEDGNPG